MIKTLTIVGTGALATYYGVLFSRVCKVQMLGSWSEGVDVLNNEGRIVEGSEEINSSKISAFTDWGEAQESDLVLWLTKSYKNKQAQQKFNNLKWSCPILLMQNGLPDVDWLKQFFNVTIVGCTNQGAKLLAPGVVQNTGEGIISIEDDPLLSPQIKNLFQSIGVEIKVDKNIEGTLLKKLSVNVVLNPTTYLFDVLNGEAIVGQPCEFLKRMIKAVFPFFKNKNIYESESEYFAYVCRVAMATQYNVNSMLSDKMNNQPTEIENLFAPILKSHHSAFLEDVIKKIKLENV